MIRRDLWQSDACRALNLKCATMKLPVGAHYRGLPYYFNIYIKKYVVTSKMTEEITIFPCVFHTEYAKMRKMRLSGKTLLVKAKIVAHLKTLPST